MAVLEKRGGLKVSACDAYLNIIGGLSLDEPAADLAAVIALASSYLDRPVPADLVAIGEVGLTGELRSVSQLGQRVSEVRRLGFTQCLIPSRRGGAVQRADAVLLIHTLAGTGNQTHTHHPISMDLGLALPKAAVFMSGPEMRRAFRRVPPALRLRSGREIFKRPVREGGFAGR